MASRCVSTLNDLDKISDRIYSKHSKGRFRAGIEAKLKAAREKTERSLREIDQESSYSGKTAPSYRSSVRTSSATTSSRCFSISASTASRSTASEHPSKVGKEKISKSSTTSTKSTTTGQRADRIQRRKTKSCPSCPSSNNIEEKSKASKSDIPRTVSVFGKYNGKESEYKPTVWFNLPQGTSVGVIDSFACNAKNEKPLCYSINVKKGKSVPNLLRHDLEVRVGQNGIVRTEKKGEMPPELGDRNAKQGKKRTAPLNWEEQLHWQNACVISSGLQTNGDSSSKGLCETHPVIFHEKKSVEHSDDSKRSEGKNIHSPAYKLSLETRWVYPDRRNPVSTSDKCITAVEVEDTRSEQDDTESKRRTQHGVVNVNAKQHTQNIEEKASKRVSFEDVATTESAVRITEEKRTEKLKDVRKLRKFEDAIPVSTKIDYTKKAGFDNIRKIRPKTSRERSRTNEEEMAKDVRKLQRPHTAPPAPPSSPRIHVDSQFSNCVTIKIPTSQGDTPESTNNQKTSEEKQKIFGRSVSVTPEEAEESLIENEEFPAFSVQISPCSSPEKIAVQDGSPRKRVSFVNSPRSAPVSRTATRLEEGTPRAKSSTALQRRPYRSPSPVVIESESSLELPNNLPPAQALVALRKKIREDLAQQNRELQLDIQQLYLRKHSE